MWYFAISVQVDRGSEFQGDFKKAMLNLGLKLYVLPPRSPRFNGEVEGFWSL